MSTRWPKPIRPSVILPGKSVVILRDSRESIQKCSLIPLKGRPGIEFHSFVRNQPFPVEGYLLLNPDGPTLSKEDQGKTLLVLDSSWRHLPELQAVLQGNYLTRSIPSGFQTAYPRKSKVFQDPSSGLSSVEALFIALLVLGQPDPSLLDHYYWKSQFLEKNRERFREFGSF